MEPSKIKILLHVDVIYQILQWLPVISLYRFKHVCKSWRALIESSYFIRHHLHLHHYDHSLKDKNCNLLYLLQGKGSPIFPLVSIESFEEPKVCLGLNCSDLHGCFPIKVLKIVSCNGIICLHLLNCKEEDIICLWNPANNQSRVLPQSPFHDNIPPTVGFGYDIKTNDYKVVKLSDYFPKGIYEVIIEVYSLNTGSWRSLTRDISRCLNTGSWRSVTKDFCVCLFGNIRMPFNNGTCFFWGYITCPNCTPKIFGILCFDFCSEMFRYISLPPADDCHSMFLHFGVVNDKIACFSKMYTPQTELWVLNEYGRANECWTKLYTVDTFPIIDRQPYVEIEGFSTNGNYIFKQRSRCADSMLLPRKQIISHLKICLVPLIRLWWNSKNAWFLLRKGNNAPICINKGSENQK